MDTRMTNYDCNCTSTDMTIYDDRNTQTISFTCSGSYDYYPIIEFDESHKIGWNNPRKIRIKNRNIFMKRNMSIRNNLPRKFKLDLNK